MLRTHRLSYHAGGKALINSISLEFSPGILYGILGPNGSGKTTFLKTITGIWRPSAGDVFWHGSHLFLQGRKQICRLMSLVLQSHLIPFDFLAEEMVAMGLYSHGTVADAKPRIARALTAVNAWHLRSRQVSSLSNGERQRIYIARALVADSPVILLDEPAASLDIRHQLDIWLLLKKLASKGKTVITTLHDLHFAERFCDRIAVFDHGRCIGAGPYQEIMQLSLLKQVFGITSLSSPYVQHQFQPQE
jgi:iron complex transport system ATP-binding protein